MSVPIIILLNPGENLKWIFLGLEILLEHEMAAGKKLINPIFLQNDVWVVWLYYWRSRLKKENCSIFTAIK